MSLAFLFKKTWHPARLQNSEMVWKAEQKDAAEKRRIDELTKRVREEQQVRELEEMQAAGGHGPERKERIDWMYEGPMQSAQDKQAEANEYLLGKEFKLSDKGTSELKKLEETKAPGTLFTAESATSANEAFRRVQEDPLLRMRKARIEAEESVVNNPVMMSKIRQQLEAELAAKAEKKRAKKEAKKAKKEAKKEKKRERKERNNRQEKHAREEDSSSSDDDRQHNTKEARRRDAGGGGGGGTDYGSRSADYGSRSATDFRRDGGYGYREKSGKRYPGDEATRSGTARRENERERRDSDRRGRGSSGGGADWTEGHRHRAGRDEYGYHRHSRTDRRSGDGQRVAHRDRDEERRSTGRGERYSNGGGDRRDHRNGSGGRDRRNKSVSRSRSANRDHEDKRERRQHHRHRSGRKRSRSRSGSPSPTKTTSGGTSSGTEGKRYGLVGGKGGRGGGSLGPAVELLKAKEKEREEKEKAMAEARRRRVMTSEEKIRRLKEMEDDGSRNQELKRQRLEEGKRADARDRDGTGVAGKTEEASASFLDKMRSEQVDAMGLEERMQRNRHYHQRGADVHNFMDRG